MSNLVGKTYLNRFRVDSFVASGGMSVVYRVWDLERSAPLAMKVLSADLAYDPSIIKRFQREARALQNLAHPHIVPFYGLYQVDDLTFLVEQYIDGPTLKDLLKRYQGQGMPVQEVLVYLKALCSALSYAHKNGVVHCDIKPGNVMIDQGGNIFLADFGVARHAESTTTTLGGAGTPAYMAPEQIRGEAVTPATDIYALGVVLYELLTGQRPFAGSETSSGSASGTAAERVRLAHLTLQPPNPLEINPNIPPGLASVALVALAKLPAQRYQTAQDLFNAACMAAGIRPEQIPSRVVPPPVEPSGAYGEPLPAPPQSSAPLFSAAPVYAPQPPAPWTPAALSYAPPAPPPSQPSVWRSPWLWAGAALALVILCAALGIALGLPMIHPFLASPTPLPTAMLSATSAFPGSQAQPATSTLQITPTFLPSASPLPSLTPTPSPAPPSDTPAPTLTATLGIIKFIIKNVDPSRGFDVYVDGKYLGYYGVGMENAEAPTAGKHLFKLCPMRDPITQKPIHCFTVEKNVPGPQAVVEIP